jgi:hypothetical protein
MGVVLPIVIIAFTAAAQDAADVGFRKRLTPYDAYAAAIEDTLPRLEPLFQAYRQAVREKNQAKQAELHRKIALRNSLGDWRRKFFEWGRKNSEQLSSEARAVWNMIANDVRLRDAATSPKELLTIPPPQIRQAIIMEREAFLKAVKESRGLNESRQSAIAPGGDPSYSGQAPPTQHLTPQPSRGSAFSRIANTAFPVVPVAIIAAVIIGILIFLVRRRSP